MQLQQRKVTDSFLTSLFPPAENPVPSRRSSTKPGRIFSLSPFAFLSVRSASQTKQRTGPESDGFMNWSTQFLQRTCPHGLASVALDEFVRPFLQAGQIRRDFFVSESVSSVKLTVTRVCSE